MQKNIFTNKAKKLFSAAVLGMALFALGTGYAAYEPFKPADADNFYQSKMLKVEKVSFKNLYDLKVAGNLYLPKNMQAHKKYSAIIVAHPMGAAVRSGLCHSTTLEQRREFAAAAAEQRYAEFQNGEKVYTSGTVHEITEKSNAIEKEFFDFYRTDRGEVTPAGASPLTTTHPILSSFVKFMNFYPFNDIETISPRPLLFIAGENAHSIEFSEDAYRLAAEPKELYLVKGAGHVDLYDRVDLIPFSKLGDFFHKYLD